MPRPPALAPKASRVTLRYDDPVVAAALEWKASAMPEASLLDVVREALALLVGTEPLEATAIAIRDAAWRRASARSRELLGLALRQAADLYRQDPIG